MRRIHRAICSIVCTLCVGFPLLVAAADSGKTQSAPIMPVYKPPMRGAPTAQARVGGGTRGTHDALTVTVLAPDHLGLTIQPQPTLYWHVTQPTNAHIEVTLIDGNGEDPLLETTIASSPQGGIQRLSLAEHGATLQPGVEYQWFVAVVGDAHHRSTDVVASGTIERVQAAAPLRAKLAKADATAAPAIYAEEGMWYDAVDSVSELIRKQPDNRALYGQRAALLEQVGLNAVAQEDRQGNRPK